MKSVCIQICHEPPYDLSKHSPNEFMISITNLTQHEALFVHYAVGCTGHVRISMCVENMLRFF